MYKLNDAEMFFDMEEGQAVVINFSTGAYYGTTALGSEVLSRLLRGCATQKILAALKAAPGCPADIERHLTGFVSMLLDNRIVTEGETTAGGDEEISKDALIDGFDMTLNEYNEVGDLIMADPIHEVVEDAGWPLVKEK